MPIVRESFFARLSSNPAARADTTAPRACDPCHRDPRGARCDSARSLVYGFVDEE